MTTRIDSFTKSIADFVKSNRISHTEWRVIVNSIQVPATPEETRAINRAQHRASQSDDY